MPFGKWTQIAQIPSNGSATNLTISYLDTDLLCQNEYQYKIRSYRSTPGSNDGVFPSYLSFAQSNSGNCNLPGTPVPQHPSGSTSTGLPSFTWDRTDNGDTYTIRIYDSNGALLHEDTQAADDLCQTSSCSYQPPQSLTDGNYSWKVSAGNSFGESAESESLSFEVATTVWHEFPKGDVANNYPTFRWHRMLSATWYELWVQDANGVLYDQWFSSEEACGNLPFCETRIDSVTLPVNQPLSWSVRTYEPGSHRPWPAQATDFRIALDPPAAPYPLLSPAGQTFGNVTTFAWVETPGDAWYQLALQLQGTEAKTWWFRASDVCDQGVCEIDLDPRNTRVINGNHTWWVESWNGAGRTWSAPQTFQTQVPVPTPTIALGIDSLGGKQPYTQFPPIPFPTYVWEANESAQWYWLQVVDQAGQAVAGHDTVYLPEESVRTAPARSVRAWPFLLRAITTGASMPATV